jgi:hypothetical protein
MSISQTKVERITIIAVVWATVSSHSMILGSTVMLHYNFNLIAIVCEIIKRKGENLPKKMKHITSLIVRELVN